MKKAILLLTMVLLVFGMVVGCSDSSDGETQNDTFADAPTNIFDIEKDEYAIYISDSAKPGGMGTSADDPLYPIIHPDNELEPQTLEQTQSDGSKKSVTIYSYYKNTALYQAVEKLSETGGTVVICGDYTICEDDARHSNYYSVMEYHLPETKCPVTITSVYGDEDYRSKARLKLSGYVHTILNGPTVWENMKIYTNLATDRVICCNGNETVFGEGLECTRAKSDSESYYLSIAGGERYKSTNKNVNITVKSGTFYKLLGTTWTNPGSESISNCNVNIKLEGGTVSNIYGNTRNAAPNAIHQGNVDIQITGGTLTGSIACTGAGGFKSESNAVNVKISGGIFSPNFKIMSRNANSTKTGVESKNVTVDLGGANDVNKTHLSTMVGKLADGTSVVYPSGWITENRTVKETPAVKYVFCGEELSAKGSVVEVEYKNPVLNNQKFTQTVEYDKNPESFSVKCDTSAEGTVKAEYYFGDWKYHEADVKVLKVPTVTFKGVQVKADSDKQTVYAWGGYADEEYTDVTIKECGIISAPQDLLKSDEPFTHSNTFGLCDVVSDGKCKDDSDILFGAVVIDTDIVRENNYDKNYSFRAYVKVECDGQEQYLYSDVVSGSLYDIAKTAVEGNVEADETKAILEEKVISVHENYDPTYLYDPAGAEAARKQVVDYMYKMSNIEWTPKETFILYNEGTYNQYSVSTGSTKMYAVFYAGKTYHGIPYVNKTLTQHETFLDMIDRTDIVPLDKPNLVFNRNNGTSDFDKLTPAQKEAGLQNAKNFPGNDCWGGMIYGWNTVINSRPETKGLINIDNMLTLDYGTVKVGDYEIDERYIVKDRNNTKAVVAKIDKMVMAEAYAKLQPGDATAHSTQIYNDAQQKYTSNARHVRIVSSVEVVRKANNQIDLNASKVNFIHQAGGATSVYIYNENDRSLKEVSYTFRQLMEEGSLPISIPELMTGLVDTPTAIVSGAHLDETLPYKTLSGIVKSNKHMMSVRAVFSQNGQVVGERKEITSPTYGTVQLSEYTISGIDLSEITLNSGENYTFDLYACIAGMDGEEIHLVKGYEFTAK
ncbi:MAG: hypothetical protein IJN17_09435 [Clostridia bacterium]|nr:hypothetical protein [Clostridia bacterium]